MSVNTSTAATRKPSACAAFLAAVNAASERGASNTIVPPALKFIRPGISQRSPAGSTMSSEGVGDRRYGDR